MHLQALVQLQSESVVEMHMELDDGLALGGGAWNWLDLAMVIMSSWCWLTTSTLAMMTMMAVMATIPMIAMDRAACTSTRASSDCACDSCLAHR